MSPILLRPVREQLEHDRVIRLLQAKYKRKFDVSINPGSSREAPVGTGANAWYPDLVLQSANRGRKLLGVVEVETTESVTHLEAMSQWGAFARLRAAFHLYVPAAEIDTARRLCTALNISVSELWAYATFGDQVRFTLVQRSGAAPDRKAQGSVATGPARESAKKKAPGKRAVSGRASARTPRRPASAAAATASRPSASTRRAAGKAAPARGVARKSVRRPPKRK